MKNKYLKNRCHNCGSFYDISNFELIKNKTYNKNIKRFSVKLQKTDISSAMNIVGKSMFHQINVLFQSIVSGSYAPKYYRCKGKDRIIGNHSIILGCESCYSYCKLPLGGDELNIRRER